MSDNGWMLSDHGFTSKVLPFKASNHVPFWVAGPGIRQGANASLVSNLDIYPTILNLAELEMSPRIYGKSLLPILTGERDKVGIILFIKDWEPMAEAGTILSLSGIISGTL
jgi:arylsulfatase A-like enzyme